MKRLLENLAKNPTILIVAGFLRRNSLKEPLTGDLKS